MGKQFPGKNMKSIRPNRALSLGTMIDLRNQLLDRREELSQLYRSRRVAVLTWKCKTTSKSILSDVDTSLSDFYMLVGLKRGPLSTCFTASPSEETSGI